MEVVKMKILPVVTAVLTLSIIGCSKNPVSLPNKVESQSKLLGKSGSVNIDSSGEHEFDGEEEGEFGKQDTIEVNTEKEKKIEDNLDSVETISTESPDTDDIGGTYEFKGEEEGQH